MDDDKELLNITLKLIIINNMIPIQFIKSINQLNYLTEVATTIFYCSNK